MTSKYMLEVKKFKEKKNSIPEEKCCIGKWLTQYYYASAVDYILDADGTIKGLSDRVRFLYTQMHTFGAAATTIIFTNIILFILLKDLPCLSDFSVFTLLTSLIVAGVMMLLMKEISERIYVWRRILIDNNSNELENILQGEGFKKTKSDRGCEV